MVNSSITIDISDETGNAIAVRLIAGFVREGVIFHAVEKGDRLVITFSGGF